MKVRHRTLVIALLLAVLASAIALTIFLVPADGIPPFHYVTDLQTHVAALDHTDRLGLQQPSYDTDPNPNIALINIDDASLKTIGAFPWKRGVYGKLLNHLAAAGAKTVVFDMDFVEPAQDPTQDAIFAAGMRKVPTVVAYTINMAGTGEIQEDAVAPTLRRATKAVGFSSIDTPGGYMIGMHMVIQTGSSGENSNQRLVALPMAAAETMLGHRIDDSQIPQLDGEMLLIPPSFTQTIGIDKTQTEEFNAPPFAGHSMLSFSDALTEPPKDLRIFANGALVYIGSTAAALSDFQTTTRGRTPGMFINARLADQILRNQVIKVAPLWVNVLLIFALPMVIALLFTITRIGVAIVASLVATAGYAYLSIAIFVTKLLWLDLVHVVAGMLLTMMFVALYRVIHEGGQRRMVTNLFGMHVSPAIVSDILAQDDPGGALALKGKRVKTTIFYSDIRGFTAMSETMTPEEIYTQLNEYFEEMCTIIFKYGGYVDKFIGDCVMAVFSAPYPTPDDAANATRSAVEQQKKILELSAKWKALGKHEFTVGMGINTGDVVMGNLGASSRMNYTVIGDNVNVAARLYNVAKGGEIIISESTYQEVKDIVVATELEPVAVKGKVEPIRIYNITDIKTP